MYNGFWIFPTRQEYAMNGLATSPRTLREKKPAKKGAKKPQLGVVVATPVVAVTTPSNATPAPAQDVAFNDRPNEWQFLTGGFIGF